MPLEELRLFHLVFSETCHQHALWVDWWPNDLAGWRRWMATLLQIWRYVDIRDIQQIWASKSLPWRIVFGSHGIYMHDKCHVKKELRLTLLIAEMAKELVKSLFHLISCNSKLVKIVLFSKIVSTWLCDVSSPDGWTLVFFFRQFFSDRLRLHRFIFWIHGTGIFTYSFSIENPPFIYRYTYHSFVWNFVIISRSWQLGFSHVFLGSSTGLVGSGVHNGINGTVELRSRVLKMFLCGRLGRIRKMSSDKKGDNWFVWICTSGIYEIVPWNDSHKWWHRSLETDFVA